MSHDGLRVHHASLEGAAADLTTTYNNLNNSLISLDEDIKSDRQTWTGDLDNGQRAAYDRAKLQWDTAMTELATLLNDTSTSVTNSNADYRNADLRGAARFEFKV